MYDHEKDTLCKNAFGFLEVECIRRLSNNGTKIELPTQEVLEGVLRVLKRAAASQLLQLLCDRARAIHEGLWSEKIDGLYGGRRAPRAPCGVPPAI